MLYNPEERRGAHVFGQPHTRYQVCTQCVMDTSDPEITFDDDGICHHCHDYDKRVAAEVFGPPVGHQELARYVAQIKKEGRGKKYDCVLGLSGGVDSTYVAYLTKKLGLRPLAVHLDNGWNSEIAVRNIHNIVDILDIDLETIVLDWEEFRSLQKAFLRASTPDSEIPSDHAIVTTLFKQCIKNKVRWIMDGSNVVTEIMSPATWSHGHGDWTYIKSLNDQFGDRPLKTYPHYTYYDLTFWYRTWYKIERFPILNFIEFNKLEAMETLKRELDWTPYGGKHYESIYTRYYQGYILPTKFGFDKRRSHLSCLVRDERITRQKALAELQQPAIDEDLEREDRDFVIKKLGLTEGEFDEIMNAERKTFWDYPSDEMSIGHTPEYTRFWKRMIRYERFLDWWQPVRVDLGESPRRGIARIASSILRATGIDLLFRAASLVVGAIRTGSPAKVWAASRAGTKRIIAAIAQPFVAPGSWVLRNVLPKSLYVRVRNVARRVLGVAPIESEELDQNNAAVGEPVPLHGTLRRHSLKMISPFVAPSSRLLRKVLSESTYMRVREVARRFLGTSS